MRKAIQQLEEEIELLKNQIKELKEELQDAKDNYKSLEWHNNNQYELLNKYKKFVDILKDYLFISFEGDTIINDEEFIITIGDKERVFNHSDDVFCIVVKKEENELLKEILK